MQTSLLKLHPIADESAQARVLSEAMNVIRPTLHSRLRATKWLRATLAVGRRRATDVLSAAATAGIPVNTLKRAKAALGLRSIQIRRESGLEWYWENPAVPFPSVEEPHSSECSILERMIRSLEQQRGQPVSANQREDLRRLVANRLSEPPVTIPSTTPTTESIQKSSEPLGIPSV